MLVDWVFLFLYELHILLEMSHVRRTPVFRVSDHVLHKPGFTAIEDGFRLKIFIKEVRDCTMK